ncbi:MAG: GHKL domain-containing protein [Candidatus Eisenbacteria sp.]|nr:GHKL domain-containing protein [Candidatus Eisenbacteria bacterium]
MPLSFLTRSGRKTRSELDRLQHENEQLLAELEEVYVQLDHALGAARQEASTAYGEVVRRARSLELANKQLRDVQEQMLLSERNAAMGQMAAEIGHELKNYLAVMRGRAEMIPVAMERNQMDVARKAAIIILDHADRMERLSKGLMDFSSQKTEICACRINDVAARVIHFLEPAASSLGIRFLAVLDENLPAIEADGGQMEQVMLNLLKNAVDAMGRQPGQVVVSTRYVERENVVEITVQDEGPGIPPEIVRQIFEPRFSSKKGARGFGLAVCCRIAKNHGGSIEVESAEGKGTVFLVTLPREQK